MGEVLEKGLVIAGELGLAVSLDCLAGAGLRKCAPEGAPKEDRNSSRQ